MPLALHLLDAAQAAAVRLKDAEAALERARTAHREALRALHASGPSLREIAAALGLSHQRVHQLVAGGPASPEPAPVGTSHRCRLCGADTASPGICAGCREAAQRLIAGESRDSSHGLRLAFRHHRRVCLGCGRRPEAGERFAEGLDSAICGDCLDAAEAG